MKFERRSTLRKVVGAAALATVGLTACGGSDAASTTLATLPTTTAASTTAAPTTAAPTTPVPTTGAPVTAAPTTAAPATTAAATPPPTPAATTAPASNGNAGGRMTIEEITAATDRFGDSESVEVLTWGDIDGDGDEDAVVNTVFCGASCGFSLDLVLDQDGSAAFALYSGPEPFAPWVVGSGAGQSSVTGATISGSTITLVGTGLCGDMPIGETDEPGSCNYNTERTATYEYRDEEIRAVSIEPAPG